MKPMMILPPNLIADKYIKELSDNGICVIIAKELDNLEN